MKYFHELTVQLRQMGIFYSDSSAKAKKIAIILRCGFLVTYVTNFLTMATYFVFEAQTPREHSDGSYYTLCALLMLSWYVILLLQSDKYLAVIDELEAVIQKRTIDPTVNLIYENTNTNVEWMTKNLCIVWHVCAVLYVIPFALFSIFNYISSGYSNESFRQSMPASYPFDWKTPLGYVGCVFIQLPSAMAFVEVYTAAILFTIGFCMFTAGFAIDIKEKLDQFNRILISSENTDFTAKERVFLKKKLKEIIEFHSEAREFANRFSDVNSPIVFACPLFTVAVFGSLILQVNGLTETGDFVGILQVVIGIWSSLFPFFLFCHFGGKVTQQFEDIGNAAYQIEWYRLPLNVQKDLQTVIALAQKPIYMRGYGDTRTTHSVLNKILKNKFYYFMFTRKV